MRIQIQTQRGALNRTESAEQMRSALGLRVILLVCLKRDQAQ